MRNRNLRPVFVLFKLEKKIPIKIYCRKYQFVLFVGLLINYSLNTFVSSIISNDNPLNIIGIRCWNKLVLAILSLAGST